MSYQTLLNNRTSFSAEKFIIPDQNGQEVLLVVVMATFEAVTPTSPLQLVPEQIQVRPIDEHYGGPADSSVQYEGNLSLEKPFVDILINAHAYAPKGKASRKVNVEVKVGDIHKSLLVQGDRRWTFGLFGRSPSKPKKFLKIPIIYERAFGGVDISSRNPKKRRTEPRNPIGVGFRGTPSHDPNIHIEVPNVEYPRERMSSRRNRPRPAGLGAISRSWKPRIDYAGTYDDTWLNEHWPLLPLDFDPRHNQSAPVDQQSRTIQGGETVQLLNLTPEGSWTFKLPTLDIPVHLLYDSHRNQSKLRMDTVLIEPDIYRVTLTSRLKLVLPRNQDLLREIVLGHQNRAWLRAKIKRKKYLDWQGTDGAIPNKQSFHL